MDLASFADKLPESDREAFKSLAAKAIVISSREDAEALLQSNDFLVKARHAIVSDTTLKYDKRFKEEELPKIIEAELKKRNPDKNPMQVELETMKAELAETKRQAALKEHKALAQKALADAGLPLEFADYAVRETEEETANELKKLMAPMKAFVDGAVKKALGDKLGNQRPPVAGGSGEADFSKMSVTEQMQYARQSPEHRAAVEAHMAKRK